MSELTRLMEQRRWCYYLSKTEPEPGQEGPPKRWRVSIVIENHAGHYPTGAAHETQAPWYWDDATCVSQNAKRGISERDALEIVGSSMAAGRV